MSWFKDLFKGTSATYTKPVEEIEKQRQESRERLEGFGWEAPEEDPQPEVIRPNTEPVDYQEKVDYNMFEERKNTLLDKIKGYFTEGFAASGAGAGGPAEALQPEPMQEVQAQEEGPKYVFRSLPDTQDKQPIPQEYESAVDRAAQEYGIDPNILATLLANESGHNWDPNNIGDNGNAHGLSQITIGSFWNSPHYGGVTFNNVMEYGEALRNDPEFAIFEGARILKHKTDSNGGDPFTGLMRYNGGGQDALNYATEGFRRIGYEVPERR